MGTKCRHEVGMPAEHVARRLLGGAELRTPWEAVCNNVEVAGTGTGTFVCSQWSPDPVSPPYHVSNPRYVGVFTRLPCPRCLRSTAVIDARGCVRLHMHRCCKLQRERANVSSHAI